MHDLHGSQKPTKYSKYYNRTIHDNTPDSLVLSSPNQRYYAGLSGDCELIIMSEPKEKVI